MKKLHRIRGRDPPPAKVIPHPSRNDILSEMDLFGRTPADVATSAASHDLDSWDEPTVIEAVRPTQRVPTFDQLDDLDSVSLSGSYSGEWERLFKGTDFVRKLRHYGLRGKLRSSRFRSLCWKLYLDVLPEDPSLWVERTKAWRDRYSSLKEKLVVNPSNMEFDTDLSLNNPLSQDVESPWNQFFNDNQLRLTIRQDVIRTYPRIEFFHNDAIRCLMVDLLFIYAKLNPLVSYRQGMHELLAPLIFVLHCDHQAFLHACETDAFGNVVKEMLDPTYLEHDTFAMLCQIMASVESWYVSNETPSSPPSPLTPPASFEDTPFVRVARVGEEGAAGRSSNAIVGKLLYIEEHLLKRFDLPLYDRLHSLEIEPQIYGIRWLRLLFGRELPMQDLLVLWDAIFSDGVHFDLVDYIFVAMLAFLREALLNLDYPSCLSLLMRYPPVADVHYFIELALHMRQPNHQPRPGVDLYHRAPIAGSRVSGTPAPVNTGGSNLAEKAATVMTNLSSLTRRLQGGNGDGTSLDSAPGGGMAKSSSEPMSLMTEDPTFDCGAAHGAHRHWKSSTSSLSNVDRPIRASRGARASREMTSWPSRSAAGCAQRSQPQADGAPVDHQVEALVQRLAEMERMAELCGHKMSVHLRDAQEAVMADHTLQAGSLLLSLAGLKQVKDVLLGTLKVDDAFRDDEPATSEPEGIEICDNHYCAPPPAVLPPGGTETRPADVASQASAAEERDFRYEGGWMITNADRRNLDGLTPGGATRHDRRFPSR